MPITIKPSTLKYKDYNGVFRTADCIKGQDAGDNTETISGSAPSITGIANKVYVCGECLSLSVTAPAKGSIDVLFTSGQTATVLTVASAKAGVSAVKWSGGFNPASLNTNTTYRISIMEGEYGTAWSWT